MTGLEMVTGAELAEAMARLDPTGSGVVIEAAGLSPDWPSAKAALMDTFAISQRVASEGGAIVYVVHGDDLLGRRGAPSAMVATGLLSAARTAAIELSRQGSVVNVVARGDGTPADTVARWVARLTEPDGPTGEIVRLDQGHLGKALP